MNSFPRLLSATVAALLSAVAAQQALADPPDIFRDYRFITSRSTVHVSGGFAGFDMDLAIQGSFGLVTGYDYSVDPTSGHPTIVRYAQFVDVDAILFNPLSMAPIPLPGWDLDQTLNLTGLNGTFQIGDPTRLFFDGEDGQGQPIHLEATLRDRLLHLVGANDPGCCDFFHYKIDALAYLKPYPDWNLDDTIDAADYVLLRKAAGTPDEYGAWQEVFGANMAEDGASAAAAPEPTTLMLLLIAALASPAVRSARAVTRASA